MNGRTRHDPRQWIGKAGGRQAAWRRTMLRRGLSLTLLAVASLVLLGRLEAATHRDRDAVVVSARAVAAGATLTAADLRISEVDTVAIAPAAIRDIAAAVGQRAAGPMGPGEQLTRSRVLGPAVLLGQPSGTGAVWLPTQGDPRLSGLQVGERVDGYLVGQREPAFTDAVLLSVSSDTPEFAARSSIVANHTRLGVLVALDKSQIGDVFAGQRPEAGTTAYVLVAR